MNKRGGFLSSNTTRFLLSIFFKFIFLMAVHISYVSAQTPLVVVETANVVDMKMAPTMWAPGTVVSRNDAKIAAEVSGRITWIAEAGTQLKQGDVIAEIDPLQFELNLAQSEAQIAQLEASLEYNDRQLERLQKLANQNSASKTQLDEITAGRNVVLHQLTSARVAKDRSLYDLDRATVKSPYTGQWVERHQQLGEYTRVGNSLGRLVDTKNKEVRARAPIITAPYITNEMPLRVKGKTNSSVYPVRAIIPVGDEISRSLEIRVVIDDVNLLVGSAVRVAVPNARPEHVIAVPRDALVIRHKETYVYRIVDGVAEQIPVSLGMAQGNYISVRGELSGGDVVVVRGAERLRSGQSVKIL